MSDYLDPHELLGIESELNQAEGQLRHFYDVFPAGDQDVVEAEVVLRRLRTTLANARTIPLANDRSFFVDDLNHLSRLLGQLADDERDAQREQP